MSFVLDKCLICQTSTTESTIAPSDSLLRTNDDVFEEFLDRVRGFTEIGALPVNLEHLPTTEIKGKRWIWHISCRRKFEKQNLERARHRNNPKPQLITSRPTRSIVYLDLKTRCFVCKQDQDVSISELHAIMTEHMDRKIKRLVNELDMNEAIAMLAGTDVLALEWKYHSKCLRDLERQCEKKPRNQDENLDSETSAEMEAMEELLAYIQAEASEGNDLFPLDELAKLYENNRLAKGIKKLPVHRTRFKNEILSRLPHLELREEQRGKFKYLIGSASMKEMIQEALERRRINVPKMFKKAADLASMIRDETQVMNEKPFTGEFHAGCQKMSIPPLLLFFCRMLLEGPKAINLETSQAVLSASQILCMNIKGLRKKQRIEPPLPVYLGIYAHTRFRSKELIDELNHLGLSISYYRTKRILAEMEHVVAQQAREDQVMCPRSLNQGSFILGAFDNADHNPSSTTAKDSFHGTVIVAFGSPTGVPRQRVMLNDLPRHLDPTLPTNFTNIIPFKKKLVSLLPCPKKLTQTTCPSPKEFKKEEDWVNLVKSGMEQTGTIKTWSSYHATGLTKVLPWSVGTYPLFHEKSTDPAMIKHCMLVIQATTNKLNPDQTATIITADQVLFALAKKVLATCTTEICPTKFVLMLGGFHFEKAIWATIGDMLNSSGWIEAITDAGITTTGRADSFLKAAHLTRTRYGHEVTLAVLDILLKEAYDSNDVSEPIDIWIKQSALTYPTFKFWILIKEYQTLALMYIRAHREANFKLYVQTMKRIIPLFFAMDHTNYARWATVHLLDMESLPSDILEAFYRGYWVIRKTARRFSAIPTDQALEQENKRLKAAGGMIGLTENVSALQQNAIVATVVSPILESFRSETGFHANCDADTFHHEESASHKRRFECHIRDLLDVMRKEGSPFLETSNQLVTLHGQVCLDSRATKSVTQLKDLGKAQFENFKLMMTTVGDSQTKIPMNQLILFKVKKERKKLALVTAAKSFKQHASILGQLMIAGKSRNSNMKEIFCHEIEDSPPALSIMGKLYTGKKSDLLQCIKKVNDDDDKDKTKDKHPPSYFDAVIIDGGNFIHSMVPSGGNTTFGEFVKTKFCSAIRKEFYYTSRLDIVWDRYLPGSIKVQTREKRGTGLRQRVNIDGKMPADFKTFLRDSNNKTELFNLLSREGIKMTLAEENDLYLTYNEDVLHVGSGSAMGKCNHEEADTRVVVHVIDALTQGKNVIKVKTGDTDVVVILCGQYHRIKRTQVVWIDFGSGKERELLNLRDLCSSLTPEMIKVLPMFHAISGCDTTSSFKNRGKRMFFVTWKNYPELTDVLLKLIDDPFQKIDTNCPLFKEIEKFIIGVYNSNSSTSDINEARFEMFCKSTTADLHRIPPTKNALLHHIKRAILQGGRWSSAYKSHIPDIPIEEFGWKIENGCLKPRWLSCPTVPNSIILVRCGCKKGACTTCNCGRRKLPCTNLCACACVKK